VGKRGHRHSGEQYLADPERHRHLVRASRKLFH
jgi:hypothetical protein